ncbi:2'-5' RNA ligase family protein [Rickettsiales bacterium LUAb2]
MPIHIWATNKPTEQLDIFISFSKQLNKNISDFNYQLDKAKIIQKYDIEPFINKYPPHLTIYLTSFDMNNLEQIKNKVQQLANHTSKFFVIPNKFELMTSNFLMLSVNINDNQELQKISNQLVSELSEYRDINYHIPDWAKSIKNKVKVFKKYGSPNVFNEFQPHFSIFYANKISLSLQKQFNQDINNFIKQYNYQPKSIMAESLNIGIANKDGQMIKIIASYPLK